MSSSVCRPLKRAKSTVGEPLVSWTAFPPASVAEILTCTLNETTLASGASVPMTNEAPVGVCELFELEEVTLPQPAVRRVAIDKETRDGRMRLPDFRICISDSPLFSANVRGLTDPIAGWAHSRSGGLVCGCVP